MTETTTDLQEIIQYQSCAHDEVPAQYPNGSDGFGRQFTYKVKTGKKFDIVELPIEQPSLVRLYLHMEDESRVSVFLLHPENVARDKRKKAAEELIQKASTRGISWGIS